MFEFSFPLLSLINLVLCIFVMSDRGYNTLHRVSSLFDIQNLWLSQKVLVTTFVASSKISEC